MFKLVSLPAIALALALFAFSPSQHVEAAPSNPCAGLPVVGADFNFTPACAQALNCYTTALPHNLTTKGVCDVAFFVSAANSCALSDPSPFHINCTTRAYLYTVLFLYNPAPYD